MERKEITKTCWRVMIYSLIGIGVIAWSVFSSSFYMPSDYSTANGYASIGAGAIGVGIGFMFSRVWKIKEIDK